MSDLKTKIFLQELCKVLPCRNSEILLQSLNSGTVPEFICDYESPIDDFCVNYLFAEVVSKYSGNLFAYPVDKREKAVKDFLEQEERNRTTNKRLRSDVEIPYLNRAQRIAKRLLGPLERNLDSIKSRCYFGPGTNVGARGKTAMVQKVTGRSLTCTGEFLPFAISLFREDPWLNSLILGSDGLASILHPVLCVSDAKLAFVPKNAKTDRSITVEPLLNSYLQNGIGVYLRNRLKWFNIHLDDQTVNREAARTALSRGWATVDLSQASNSLSVALVFRMLEKSGNWYKLLDICRSKRYTSKEQLIGCADSVNFQLFAGMGNGYTFALETIIFFALAKAVMDGMGIDEDPIVYGDDILIPVGALPELIRLFSSVGLAVNEKKTHAATPFRESCGGHYFHQVDVTPFYVRRPIESVEDLFTLHNQIWLWARRDQQSFDSRVIPLLRWLRGQAREMGYVKTYLVHPELGDVGFWPLKSVGHPDFLCQWQGVRRVIRPRRLKGHRGYWCFLWKALQAPDGSEPSYGKYNSRGDEFVLKEKRILHFGYKFPYIMV